MQRALFILFLSFCFLLLSNLTPHALDQSRLFYFFDDG